MLSVWSRAAARSGVARHRTGIVRLFITCRDAWLACLNPDAAPPLAASIARVLQRRCPSEEGAGNAGCALHPRSRVQIVRNLRTRAYRFSGNTPASPAQWLYGLWRALLGDEFCLATVAGGLKVLRSPVGP